MDKIVVVVYRDGGSRDFILKNNYNGKKIASVKITGVVDDFGERVYRWKAICHTSEKSEVFDNPKEACRKCEEYILESTGIKYLS